MTRKNTLLALFFSMLFFSSLAQTTLDTAADFTIKDIQGVTHNLYSILDDNKYVLLDFFTTSCGPCVTYAPDMQQAYTHFGSNQGDVFFLGINYGDDNAGVSYFDSLYGITFPSVSGINGHGNTVTLQVYDVQSFPTLVFIAPNRLILNQQIYPPSFAMIDSTLSAGMGITTGFTNKIPMSSSLQVQRISPNPVRDEANLTLNTSRAMEVGVQVVSITGSKVYSREKILLTKGTQTIQIPAASLDPGMYIVRIISEKETVAVVKFVKK